MIQISLVVLSCANLLIDFVADFSVSLCLFFDQLEYIKLLEALSSLKFLNDLGALFVGVLIATRSDKQDGRLNIVAELSESLIKVLLGVDLLQAAVSLKERHQSRRVLIVLSNTLGHDGRRLVRIVCLSECHHTLLAQVLRALESKHSRR